MLKKLKQSIKISFWGSVIFQVHSACDERNNTLVTYQWVEPRTCRDDLPSSAKLPSGAERRKCPPCNPGMQMDYTTGTCRFCPSGSISDGIRPCRSCPPSTAPNTGFQFIWWSALPGVMSSRCMSLEGYFFFRTHSPKYQGFVFIVFSSDALQATPGRAAPQPLLG